ncbi:MULTISPECIES: DUF1345 domain-containing protein [unclassified Cryobacterium]|uniref:DUF1345 domain-containing protein n=1 Tax=unclassified Cryobacterium TaxID=2649013 RepID=UPI002AB4CD91|nr:MULTISPECIES: DUF1345 domain-containing protein [unclassified Cryobacterium]MDY7526316.1 DUF1345 domain-containing protein [Cryobacterium sp. 10C2]MDY7528344.1 DUF1345 domain-containing protein [Cryobacterium sp. 10C2]MDY7555911.1 DUF1345 domain-containing protein [Cryobacterium sp. 10C3]MDY7557879.1 DUF1345 domain-containing protein [Cryobacterium sp. 10C3]MEB0291202.1 DUF1345 domain-containing protein [Cryobacterium sp. 10C2]
MEQVQDFRSTIFHAGTRASVALIVGVLVGVASGLIVKWAFAPAIGWVGAAVVFLSWTWIAVGRLDHSETARYATREDPSRFAAEVLILCASIASFWAIALILIEAGTVEGLAKAGLVALALSTIAASWLMVTTVFTLRYAHLYYSNETGGIDFNQREPPRYSDFAYLAVTIGATFQVSDTNLQNHDIRITALRHSLLSYVLGVVVLATTINLVSGLAH